MRGSENERHRNIRVMVAAARKRLMSYLYLAVPSIKVAEQAHKCFALTTAVVVNTPIQFLLSQHHATSERFPEEMPATPQQSSPPLILAQYP